MRSLLTGLAEEPCRAVVVMPARNEVDHLRAAIEALTVQVDGAGKPMHASQFEVLLLLNNCSDGSAELCRSLRAMYRDQVRLHVVEHVLAPGEAHVGMARRLLMDTAWRRLEGKANGAILSTDADTVVAPDWIAENLRALGRADVVGGEICWAEGELERLPAGVRRAYLADRQLQHMVAELESVLDPVPEDPWPRHTHTFGASLGCTTTAYAKIGGLPIQPALEDMEFVIRARRSGAKVRHEPRVKVYTSSRLRGQVEVGLSGQLREWKAMDEAGQEHWVPSAELIAYRARWVGTVRRYAVTRRADELLWLPERCQGEVRRLAVAESMPTRLIERCAEVIESAFVGETRAEAGDVLRKLGNYLETLRRGGKRDTDMRELDRPALRKGVTAPPRASSSARELRGGSVHGARSE